MSVIIRLQGLSWLANAADIRKFFTGLSIPDGGVHIVGGDDGDAFIAFASDEAARLAMKKDSQPLKGHNVRLLLSSKAEMQAVIQAARGELLEAAAVTGDAATLAAATQQSYGAIGYDSSMKSMVQAPTKLQSLPPPSAVYNDTKVVPLVHGYYEQLRQTEASRSSYDFDSGEMLPSQSYMPSSKMSTADSHLSTVDSQVKSVSAGFGPSAHANLAKGYINHSESFAPPQETLRYSNYTNFTEPQQMKAKVNNFIHDTTASTIVSDPRLQVKETTPSVNKYNATQARIPPAVDSKSYVESESKNNLKPSLTTPSPATAYTSGRGYRPRPWESSNSTNVGLDAHKGAANISRNDERNKNVSGLKRSTNSEYFEAKSEKNLAYDGVYKHYSATVEDDNSCIGTAEFTNYIEDRHSSVANDNYPTNYGVDDYYTAESSEDYGGREFNMAAYDTEENNYGVYENYNEEPVDYNNSAPFSIRGRGRASRGAIDNRRGSFTRHGNFEDYGSDGMGEFSRSDFDGGRGRSRFDRGRGGYLADRGMYDGTFSGYGVGYDGVRGGYDSGRGGYDCGRGGYGGGYDSGRGGYDGGRGGYDIGRGGYDGGRGGYEGGRGGYDGGRGGYDSGRGRFDPGRGSRGGFKIEKNPPPNSLLIRPGGSNFSSTESSQGRVRSLLDSPCLPPSYGNFVDKDFHRFPCETRGRHPYHKNSHTQNWETADYDRRWGNEYDDNRAHGNFENDPSSGGVGRYERDFEPRFPDRQEYARDVSDEAHYVGPETLHVACGRQEYATVDAEDDTCFIRISNLDSKVKPRDIYSILVGVSLDRYYPMRFEETTDDSFGSKKTNPWRIGRAYMRCIDVRSTNRALNVTNLELYGHEINVCRSSFEEYYAVRGSPAAPKPPTRLVDLANRMRERSPPFYGDATLEIRNLPTSADEHRLVEIFGLSRDQVELFMIKNDAGEFKGRAFLCFKKYDDMRSTQKMFTTQAPTYDDNSLSVRLVSTVQLTEALSLANVAESNSRNMKSAMHLKRESNEIDSASDEPPVKILRSEDSDISQSFIYEMDGDLDLMDCIEVTNLNQDTTIEDILRLFEDVPLSRNDVLFCRHYETETNIVAFVRFPRSNLATRAKLKHNGLMLHNQQLSITLCSRHHVQKRLADQLTEQQDSPMDTSERWNNESNGRRDRKCRERRSRSGSQQGRHSRSSSPTRNDSGSSSRNYKDKSPRNSGYGRSSRDKETVKPDVLDKRTAKELVTADDACKQPKDPKPNSAAVTTANAANVPAIGGNSSVTAADVNSSDKLIESEIGTDSFPVLISNLPFKTGTAQLLELLSDIFPTLHEEPERLQMRTSAQGRSLGEAIIYFHSALEADTAMRQLKGRRVAGRVLSTTYMQQQPL